MPRHEVEIVDKLGLHARASGKLTHLASQFQCEVWIECGQRRVNAKSIMGVMMLAAGKGSKIIIETLNATDDNEALTALITLVADRFGESE